VVEIPLTGLTRSHFVSAINIVEKVGNILINLKKKKVKKKHH
jgi:hypothetical protein